MNRLAAILLLILSPALQADDLFKSATDAIKDAGGSKSMSVPANLDFSGGLSAAVTQGLGVTGKQADGGLGSLFSLAQATLGENQFGSLASAVPGMDGLLKAAPALGSGASSMTGGLSGYAEAASGAAAVYSQFQSLGLSANAIPQYIGIVNSYLQSTGGQKAVDLFSKGVASLL